MQEPAVLLRGAEAHHPLDPGPVVPGPVEQHDLAGRRQVLDVALEVPLGALALGRRRQRHDPGDPGVQVLGDALDRAALARRVPALEHHHDPPAAGPDPLLHRDQLGLQPEQLALVDLAGDPLPVAAPLPPPPPWPLPAGSEDLFRLFAIRPPQQGDGPGTRGSRSLVPGPPDGPDRSGVAAGVAGGACRDVVQPVALGRLRRRRRVDLAEPGQLRPGC